MSFGKVDFPMEYQGMGLFIGGRKVFAKSRVLRLRDLAQYPLFVVIVRGERASYADIPGWLPYI